MRLKGLGWSVLVSGVLAAAFAPVALAEAPGGPTHNGLSSKAFRRNALTTNKESLKKLLKYPLNDGLFLRDDAYIGRQLRDPKAMAMMEELVACALDSKTEVTARDPGGTVLGRWRGELGLCQSWNTNGLNESEKCQELVTACVMARVNALGKSIPLSLRGEEPALSRLRDRVLTDTRLRESPRGEDPSEGWPIFSFSSQCRGRECNWSPAHVGTCTPGEEIQLAFEDSSACGSMALRACAGIHGCTGPGVDKLPDGAPLPRYSKHLGDKERACRKSPLTFTCPTDEATAGYYSVMTRPLRPRARDGSPRAHAVIKVKGCGAYPAPEQDVFRFPEGAFYGNMFKPEWLMLDCTLTDDPITTMLCKAANSNTCKIDLGSGDPVGACSEDLVSLPYRDVYACYTYAQQAEDDDASVAALNQRLCDSPDAKTPCFAYRPQRCHHKSSGAGVQQASLCTPMGSDGVYGDCASQVDPTSRFQSIITTYLNAPCDFLGEGSLCDAMRRSTPVPTGLIKVPPCRTGCAGCSLHGPGGALQPASLAAILALLLRRRRRRHAG